MQISKLHNTRNIIKIYAIHKFKHQFIIEKKNYPKTRHLIKRIFDIKIRDIYKKKFNLQIKNT